MEHLVARDASSAAPAASSSPFARVLVGSDFAPASQAAFRLALICAGRAGGLVEVVHAFQSSTRLPVTEAGPLAKQALKDFVGAFVERGSARLQRRTEYGDAFHSILGVALRGGFDLAVVGLHGRPGAWPEPGSVALNVTRSLPCAVMVVPPAGPGRANPLGAMAGQQRPQRILAVLEREPVTGGAPDGPDPVASSAATVAAALSSNVSLIHISEKSQGMRSEAAAAIAEVAQRDRHDLLVMRRRSDATAPDSLSPSAHALLRKLPCPVLFLPERRS